MTWKELKKFIDQMPASDQLQPVIFGKYGPGGDVVKGTGGWGKDLITTDNGNLIYIDYETTEEFDERAFQSAKMHL